MLRVSIVCREVGSDLCWLTELSWYGQVATPSSVQAKNDALRYYSSGSSSDRAPSERASAYQAPADAYRPPAAPQPLQWPFVSFVSRSDPVLVKERLQAEEEEGLLEKRAAEDELDAVARRLSLRKPPSTPAVASFRIPDPPADVTGADGTGPRYSIPRPAGTRHGRLAAGHGGSPRVFLAPTDASARPSHSFQVRRR